METRADQPVVKQRLIALAFAAAIPLLAGWRLDQPGIQADEVLFSSVLWEPVVPPPMVRVLGFRIPAMCFPYMGTVKSALYAVLFRFVDPSNESARWPPILLGALTVYLFCRLLQRLGEDRLAVLASALLVCDATFVFKARCDSGPVVLQWLLCVAGFYCWVRFRSWPWALAAGVCWGLGLWDKITFLWVLFGIGAGALAGLRIPWRAVPVAAFGFLLGAYPFLAHNVKTNWSSFRVEGTRELTASEFRPKAEALWYTMNGRQLFGSMAMIDGPPSQVDNTVVRIGKFAGEPTSSLFAWLVAIGLVLGWRHRYYRFAVAALLAGFAAMALAAGGGNAPHHLGLLWPLPQLIAAMGLLAMPSLLARGAMAVVLISQLLVVNQHYSFLIRFGGDMAWTDAIGPLSERIRKDPSASYRFLDWGVYDAAYLLTRGNRAMRVGIPDDAEDWTAYVYVQRAEGSIVLSDDWKRFREMAAAKRLLIGEKERIADSFGRPTFVIFRLAPNSAQ
ncbi:MAG: glycosyltransferase family 39 protein [Acidobacteria bacterium]|nr:glycosyltransferase family 39 protein [Acidobacteriota bacterium]